MNNQDQHINQASHLLFNALDGRQRPIDDTLRQSAQAVAAAINEGAELGNIDIMPTVGRLKALNVSIWQAVAAAVVAHGAELAEASNKITV